MDDTVRRQKESNAATLDWTFDGLQLSTPRLRGQEWKIGIYRNFALETQTSRGTMAFWQSPETRADNRKTEDWKLFENSWLWLTELSPLNPNHNFVGWAEQKSYLGIKFIIIMEDREKRERVKLFCHFGFNLCFSMTGCHCPQVPEDKARRVSVGTVSFRSRDSAEPQFPISPKTDILLTSWLWLSDKVGGTEKA